MNLLDLKLDTCEWQKVYRAIPLDCVLDVGANIGGFTYIYLGSGAKNVHAFEPVPWVYEELAHRFGFDPRVRLNCLGISDREYTDTNFRVYSAWSVLPSGTRKDENKQSKEHPAFFVRFTTIDAYCELGQLRPNLLKIDVDGYEVKALIGARKTISEYRPVIYIEASPMITWVGNTPEQFADEVIQHHYALVSLCGKMRLTTKQEILGAFPPTSSLDVMLLPL